MKVRSKACAVMDEIVLKAFSKDSSGWWMCAFCEKYGHTIFIYIVRLYLTDDTGIETLFYDLLRYD